MSETTLEIPKTISLSVVLPNYNDGKVLPRALGSLLAQKPAAQEIIVVDDGSDDDSVAIVERLQARHPSIRLIRNERNLGIVASVKRALEVATGEFLLCASSDDFILADLFKRAFSGLTENSDAAFFCASVALVDVRNRVIGIRPVVAPRLSRGYLSPADVRHTIQGTDFWVIGTSTIYRRKLLAEIGYFDPSLGSIGDVLANRLLAFRHGFYFDPTVLAVYNKNPASFSAQSALSVERSRRVLDAAQRWIAKKLPEDVRVQHAKLFDRRMRFGLARLSIVWREDGKLNVDAISDIIGFGSLDRKILTLFASVPIASSFLVLAWMTFRLWPFSIWGLLSAVWRACRFRLFGRFGVQRSVDETVAKSEV